MWAWVQENADAITAVVAILGLLLAASLGYLSIRVSSQTHRSEEVARSDTALIAVLDRTTRFLEVASLPYWNEPIPPADSELARVHHQAAAEVEMAVVAYSELQLTMVASELLELGLACRAYYAAAVDWATQTEGNPDVDLFAHLAVFLTDQGLESERVSALMSQLTVSIEKSYGTLHCDVMLLTSSLVEITRGNLISAYSEKAR